MRPIFDYAVYQPVSFLLVGVGGQGTILASDVLAEVGLKLGYDVKKAEIHGMSQRGGSVVSNLRWAKQVFSPIVPRGTADVIIAFEKLEASRFAEFLRKGGIALVNDCAIPPVTVTSGSSVYPSDVTIQSVLSQYVSDQVWVNGLDIAESLGNSKIANVVLVGAFTEMIGLPKKVVLAAIDARVPEKYLDINRRAFEAGIDAVHIQV
jgi:indolepyruvate ferredoxin oxidoreductase, beta subunit